MYQDSITTYDPVTGLMRFYYRITFQCPWCTQWSDYKPNPTYTHVCVADAQHFPNNPGPCPPCVDISYVEILEHYVIRYWGPGQVDPYIYTTTLVPSVVEDPGIGTIIIILIPG